MIRQLLLLLSILLLALPLAATSVAQDRGDRVFRVWVEDKNPEHPFYQQGWPEAFVLDGVASPVGVQGRDLFLERGVTYTFAMQDVPAMHPFYISTSGSGSGDGVYEDGVTGNFATGNETLTFTPGDDTPDLLYYQCSLHAFMGGRIHVIGETSVDLDPVAGGLTAPVYLTGAPDESGRLFVVDQAGIVRIIDADGALLETPFLDLTDRMVELRTNFDERGALGLAFHPDFAANGRFFVHYSAPLRDDAPDEWNHTAHISEFSVSNDDANRVDPASERIILQVDHPQFNHNGGGLAFGPDGYLYISLGDGGGANDVGLGHVDDWYETNAGGNAQAYDQNLLGSILRLDVEDEPYGIPEDNPFVGTDGLDEIWAFGLRNPYRISFDTGGDNELFAGDAGQGLWEAAYIVERGGNYGWNVREGSHCFSTDDPLHGRAECPQEDPDGRPLAPPVVEYPHARQADGLGIVVIGGHVYRGSSLPDFEGSYIFGDWSRSFGAPAGRVFATTTRHEEGPWHFSELRFANRPGGDLGHYLLGFGRDEAGEIYVLASDNAAPTGTTGVVYRLAPAGSVSDEPASDTEPLALQQNFPNPFSSTTTVSFHLERPANVTMTVVDLLGRTVATVLDDHRAAGAHRVTIDARPLALASGTYAVRLTTGDTTRTRLITVLR
jgi:glucose/arabinose dehydrogenase